MDNDSHVLMISYLYPPIDNAGTKRITKFIKYLPQFGYAPVVLTTRTRGSLFDDRHRKVIRADDLIGPFKRLYRGVKTRDLPPEDVANINLLGNENWIIRFMSTYLIPDPEIIWYPLAVREGRRVSRKFPIRMIYSTSPPETNHLVALNLKRKTGLPWVADFRDGWMFEPLRPGRLTSNFRRGLESKLESKVFYSADQLITVNKTIADNMVCRYPSEASKISIISNGFDPEDFIDLEPVSSPHEKLKIVHTGSISLSRSSSRQSLNAFIQALESIADETPELANKLEIFLAGKLAAEEIEAIQHSSVWQCFILTGNLPYKEALQIQYNSDILLLFVGTATGVSTTKLFEYLAAGKPILALSGDSEAARLILELDAGVVVDPEDYRAIKKTLLQLFEEWKSGGRFKRLDGRISQFDRRELTKQLARIFDRLLLQQ